MTDITFQRNTKQRKVILEELNHLTSHPTASELYEIVRQRLPRISLGTVYRNLELLTRMGLTQKLKISDSETRFDGNRERHYHVRCTRCRRVDDLHNAPANPVSEEIKSLDGYEILGFHLEFIGICPDCRRQKAGTDDKPGKG